MGWDRVRENKTIVSAVPGKNEKRRKVVNICSERSLCLGNTDFKHNIARRYSRVVRSQNENGSYEQDRFDIGKERYAQIYGLKRVRNLFL